MTRLLKYLFYMVCLYPFAMQGQIDEMEQKKLDSIAVKKNQQELQAEQRELNFQRFFFTALQQRAIGNYDKAIEALEQCQQLKNEDLAVIFEFSKNYFAQEKYFESVAFAKKALLNKPSDPYLLEHLKDIYVRQKDYEKALAIQLKIVDQKPQNQADLIILYIRNNRIEDARRLLVNLEKNGLLSESLEPFRASLFPGQKEGTDLVSDHQNPKTQSLDELKRNYLSKKTYPLLKEILAQQLKVNEFLELEKDSKEGLSLFPAQPFVYLMHGKALNKLKKYREAIPFLKNGLDYVIDDDNLEADFYQELSLSYKGIRQNTESSKYSKLAQEKRQKRS